MSSSSSASLSSSAAPSRSASDVFAPTESSSAPAASSSSVGSDFAAAAHKFGKSSVLAHVIKKKKFRILRKRNDYGPSEGAAGAADDAELSVAASKAAAKKANGGVELVDLLLAPSSDHVANLIANTIRGDFAAESPAAEISAVLDVNNAALAKAHRKFLAKLAQHRPQLVRNNFVTRRLYHGTYMACSLGLNGETNLCSLADCRLCHILREGFSLDAYGSNARAHPDLGPGEQTRWGRGLYFAESPLVAAEYAQSFACPAGREGRTAILCCQVAVGQGEERWDHEPMRTKPPKGFDSIHGMPADIAHPSAKLHRPEWVVFDPAATLPTQVVLFRDTCSLCPRCGVRVDFPERAGSVQRLPQGLFCSKLCAREYLRALRRVRRLVNHMPETLEDHSFAPYWEPTDSTDTAQLIDLWPGSIEATMVATELHRTLPHVEIVKIFRVQNAFLFKKYYEELQRVRKKNGNSGNERLLFHGTSSTEPAEIFDTEDGFDWRYSSWGMWGTGSYFAENASYSTNYAYYEPTGHRTMFLVKVITGDTALMNSDDSLKRPPLKSQLLDFDDYEGEETRVRSHPVRLVTQRMREAKRVETGTKIKHDRYDSCSGFTGGSRVFITYSSPKQFPAYLISYKDQYGYNAWG